MLLWQHFLMQLRSRREATFMPPVIRVDGIFGRETRRATVAFQQRYMLRVDGIVGRQTFGKARDLGFGQSTEGLAPLFGPLAKQMLAEPPPLLERPAPEPPATGTGNTREQSHARLRAESWQASGVVQSALTGGGAVFQLLKDGSGDYVYDEYSVVVDEMPSGKTPEQFLNEMATDLNGTVGDYWFDSINVFKRKGSTEPKVGDIVAIDIKGPDNGSVILVALQPNYFIFQTIDSDEYGSHPENGCREFGFERLSSGGVRFYTRGVSRPGNWALRLAGRYPQEIGWTRLLKGISAKVVSLGGKSSESTFSMYREDKAR